MQTLTGDTKVKPGTHFKPVQGKAKMTGKGKPDMSQKAQVKYVKV